MNKEELQKHIDRWTFKRIIKKPLMTAFRLFKLMTYQFTIDRKEIKQFKNKYDGQRCFIVGNGPSLTIRDLDLIKNEHCFGFNRIFDVFDKTDWRPEFYMVLDNEVLKTISNEINNISCKYKFINVLGKLSGVKKQSNIFFFCHYGPYIPKWYGYEKNSISKDASRYISLNCTVAGAAIELAIYMGFKEIYLLGIDNNITKWIDKNGIAHIENGSDYGITKSHDIMYFSFYDAVDSGYKFYRGYCDNHNIKIVNCTRGGKLEVYKREKLEDIIGD